MNVADLLTRQARATPQATAVIQADQALTYARLEALVWGLCGHLRDVGLKRGDGVGVQLDNPLLHLATILALARSGMVSVAVKAAGNSAKAAQAILRRTGATAVIDADARRDWGLFRAIVLDFNQVWALSAGPDDALRSDEPDRLLHYKTSSGTTGEPKIIGATHAGMALSIERETRCIGYPPGERYMTPVSLTFDGPRRRYLACLAAGGTAVMPPSGGDLPALIACIDAHDVRHFSCVPSQAYELAAAQPPGQLRFPHMRCLRISAGPSEAPLHRLLRERLCPHLLISFGCTELGPMTMAPPDLVASLPPTVGRPMTGVELQVVSADGEVLPTDAVGLIRVRAEGMPQAYHDDDAASADFFKHGWFYPGDLGRINAQGLLLHMGRADTAMVVNGVNIYPSEIEQAMVLHPAVREAVALPLKHHVTHQLPVCAVVLQAGAQATERDLLAFARARLGSHRPWRVVILGAIARTEHGKLQRADLLQAIVAQLDASRPPTAVRQAAATRPAGVPSDSLGTTSTSGRFGQLAMRLAVDFVLPPAPDLTRLDAWLNGVLQLDLAPPAAAGSGTPEQILAATARAWLQRALRLARLLLQVARVPVFDSPAIIRCRPDQARPGGWQAQVGLAHIDELPYAVYDIAVSGALGLIAWAAERDVDAAHLDTFYDLIEQRVSARLRPLWQQAKSTLPVLRVAHQMSIPFTHLGAGAFQLGWGHLAQRIDRSVTGRDPFIAATVCANKAMTAKWLRQAGLPAPMHRVVKGLPAALKAAAEIGWPVVVKPTDKERGEGVAVDVGNGDQLQAAVAAALASSRSKTAIIERQVEGTCHRLFIAQGRLLYAVKRLPMSVRADGVTDVAGLVAAEVARQRRLPPWERSGIQPLDELACQAIARAGFTPASIPAPGTWVALRRIESTDWGGVDEDVSAQIHPDNLKAALLATELFGLDMAGIDIISTDISRPWFETGAVINEVNFAPLLGGAEISRSHIPKHLAHFIQGDGTIPVEVFAGADAAWMAASDRWQQLVASGVQAVLTHGQLTLEPSGQAWHMAVDGLYKRTRALVMSRRVQALVLVVQTDELLGTGLPLEAVSQVTIVDQGLLPVRSDGGELAALRIQAALRQLVSWQRLPAASQPKARWPSP